MFMAFSACTFLCVAINSGLIYTKVTYSKTSASGKFYRLLKWLPSASSASVFNTSAFYTKLGSINWTTSLVNSTSQTTARISTEELKQCRTEFASRALNAAITEAAYLYTVSTAKIDPETFNRNDVLHFYWNVPEKSSDLLKFASPVRFEQPQVGGYWKPKCIPVCSRGHESEDASSCGVTVLVPFRGRSENLAVFLPWMHTFLQAQQREYRIVVLEQTDDKLFNRAKLFNVGFAEVHKLKLSPNWCFALHDVDKIPEDTRHIYECGNSPQHFVSERREAGDTMRRYKSGRPYASYFGGVSLLQRHHLERANGLSNRYFGWGREDDDLVARLVLSGMTVDYSGSESAKYLLLAHANDSVDNGMPWPHMRTLRSWMLSDGLNSLNYTANVTFEPLFTHIRANL